MSYLDVLKIRNTTESLRMAPLNRASSVRFDRDESPQLVNDGKGWNEESAMKWIERHGLVGQGTKSDDEYIRVKIRDAGRFERMWEAEPGVMVIVCEPCA